jgi:hypothetical protein
MITTDQFLWGHIPKCAGDLLLDFFRQQKPISYKADKPHQYVKHDSFLVREIRKRELILTIRKLPNFMLAWVQSVHRWGGVYPHHFNKLQPYPTDEQLTDPSVEYGEEWYRERYGTLATIADHWLNKMLGDKLELTFCARLEFIREDVIQILSEYYPQAAEEFDKLEVPIRVLGFKAPAGYNHTVADHFDQDIIDKFYENNPRWAELENQIY